MLILVTGLTAPQLFARRPILPRRLAALALGTMVLCLLLTYSRGSLAGLAVAFIVIAVLRYRRILPVMALLLIVLLLLPQAQGYVQHFSEGVQGRDLATKMRFGEYKDALILISRYPWFGVGFAGTPDLDTYLGVSSFYLLLAEQMGLIGLSVFLITVGLWFFYTLRALRRLDDPLLAPVLLGLIAAVAGALVGGVFDHYFFNLDFPHAVTLFWLYMGLGMATWREVTRPGGTAAV